MPVRKRWTQFTYTPNTLELGEPEPAVPAAVRAALPDVDLRQRLVGAAHVEDAVVGALDLVGDSVQNKGLPHRQVVDVVLGRGRGVGGGGLSIDVRDPGSQVQDGGEADGH